ncbi:MAG: CinA family protein, partial [Desulfobacterales bacterium]
EFEKLFPQFKLGFRTKFPEIKVNFYAGRPGKDKLKESSEDAVQWVGRRLGNNVFSDSGQSMEQIVGMLLRKKNATLAVAESCTGGLIANLLTDVPGSSDYFLFSAVTYANQAKMKILDVSAETLEKHGAVSEQTAGEMARGAKAAVGATYGLAASGIAGPGGGTEDKPVGTVCIGLATPLSVTGYRFNFTHHNRKRNKHIFAVTALDVLRKELMGSTISER